MKRKMIIAALGIGVAILAAPLAPSAPARPARTSQRVDEVASLDQAAGRRLGSEGVNLLRAKKFRAAVAKLIEAIRKDRSNSTNMYNLACAYALMGDATAAAKCLRMSVALGFNDYKLILSDPDFNPVRNRQPMKALMDGYAGRPAGAAQGPAPGEERFLPAVSLQPYRIILPDGYDGKTEYPLIVALHGYGDNADAFAALSRFFRQANAIFVVPRAPYALDPQDGTPRFRWLHSARDAATERRFNVRLGTEIMSRLYIERVVSDVVSNFAVNEKRVYLFGFSQGGYMAYSAGIRGRRLYAGIIACGSPLPRGVTRDNLVASRSTRIFIAHGKKDRLLPMRASDDAAKRLSQAGLKVEYRKYDDMEHNLPPKVLKEIATWILRN